MVPKQHEMDEVVKTIYETILEQDKKRINEDPNVKPTLFVLCGDHGMNEVCMIYQISNFYHVLDTEETVNFRREITVVHLSAKYLL
jgi:hypothetical protein